MQIMFIEGKMYNQAKLQEQIDTKQVLLIIQSNISQKHFSSISVFKFSSILWVALEENKFFVLV